MEKRKELANLIFPDIDKTIDDYKNMYPERNIDGSVTRFAPSPTGYMHLGGFYQAIIDYVISKNTNGVFYLRNEDTKYAVRVAEKNKTTVFRLSKLITYSGAEAKDNSDKMKLSAEGFV